MNKILGALMVVGCVSSAKAAVPSEVKIHSVEFTAPKADRVVLKNGVVVYMKEDHDLPIFDLSLRLKSSPSLEPVPDAFTLLNTVWRLGGTQTLTPRELNRRLEDRAVNLSVTANVESARLSLSCLSKTRDEALDIAMDVLFHPVFDQDQLSLARDKQLEEIRRQNDTPDTIARRAFRDVLYGSDHPYAQNPKVNTLNKVTRRHLERLWKSLVVPEGAVISVAGDFDKATLVDKLEKYFEGWNNNREKSLSYDFSVTSAPAGSLFYVEKGFTQSRIVFGRLGPQRHDPNHFALQIADYILGGGGPSRLFAEIRSRRGLAYLVGSFYVVRDGPGMIGVVCQSMAPASVPAVEAIQGELRKFSDEPPLVDEVSMAKDATINSFAFQFDTAQDIADTRADSEFFGYPREYLDTYTAQIIKIQRDDVFRVAKKYYPPSAMKIIIVGDESKFSSPIGVLGKVTSIPLDKLD